MGATVLAACPNTDQAGEFGSAAEDLIYLDLVKLKSLTE